MPEDPERLVGELLGNNTMELVDSTPVSLLSVKKSVESNSLSLPLPLLPEYSRLSIHRVLSQPFM